MKSKIFSALFILVLLAISGCVSPLETTRVNSQIPAAANSDISGLGGTGHTAQVEGIGGTGVTTNQFDGIGGTGKVADGSGMGGTGIVGTVSGFGSIRVNDLEIVYDENTAVKINDHGANARDLDIGQVVAVFAKEEGARLKAHMIVIVNALVGPVTRVSSADDRLAVMGVPVKWAGALTSKSSVSRDLAKGEFVALSGHWLPNGTLVATHARQIPTGDRIEIAGPVDAVQESVILVAGIAIDTVGANIQAAEARGRTVVVSGKWDGKTIAAQTVKINPISPFCVRAKRLNLEGYIQKVSLDGSFQILGSVTVVPSAQTSFTGGKAYRIKVGQRIQVDGSVEPNRRLVAEKIRFF